MKINSIPETEPLYTIVKSRVINIEKVKDKEERKYWRELKRANRIPDIYMPNDMIIAELKKTIEKEGRGFNG